MKLVERKLIWGLFFFALFLLFTSSDEPIVIKSLEPFFRQFDSGNTIIFNICIGYIVSLLFYLLVVFAPEKRRENELKQKLGLPVSFVLEAFCRDKGLSGIFHWSKHVIHCRPISEHLAEIDKYLAISNYKSLGDLKTLVVLQSADEILPTFEQLVPVAFQVSHQHAMIWLSLTNSIRQLSRFYKEKYKDTDTDYGELDLNLKEFVEYVKQFYNQKS
ncbi:hypothetical protein [Shewanella ulleungensis]|uniref:hypothetical protein n=1 Tax=Shewanella ulleungensis TaxID=2282699 RepID=UPI003D79BCE3